MGEEIQSNENVSNKKQKHFRFKPRQRVSDKDDAEISKIVQEYPNISDDNIKSFKSFPLSFRTQKGLRENKYFVPTEIQKQSIGPALRGEDILGAAKTGSGKTLAFLIPILERLYCKKWTRLDGVGALIISPTRELAYQIFETLKKIGAHHDFSAGLIIGGQNLNFERRRMDQCNIMICTPGRLLQHMDENALFNCANMQILVLDEADRCLDLGFESAMNSIIENLPQERQTLLFSATQTKSVRDLARLSLSNPKYIAPHEQSETSTPVTLQQNYIVCEIEEKVGILWSFIKNHLKQKTIVFMASCKEVKYIFEIFCKLRPGISLLALYGTLHQEKREQIYKEFCRKSNVVLFATDLASRGLDFPQVNWVIQMDCPEDGNTYIHRAGRTARGMEGKGEGLLMLLPSEEEAMMEELKTKKIPIKKIHVDPTKLMAPQRKMEALLAEFPDLKESAQRAFVAYAKSVFLMKNKKVFNIHAINTDLFAKSLGLVVPPRIRFLQKIQRNLEKQKKGKHKRLQKIENQDSCSDENDSDSELSSTNKEKHRKQESKDNINFHFSEDEDDDDILIVKRTNHEVEGDIEEDNKTEDIVVPERKPKKEKLLTKAAVAKKILHKKIQANTKVLFDEEGEALLDEKKDLRSELAKEYEQEDVGGIDIEKAKLVLKEEDKFDKARYREKTKAKHKEEKRKLKKAKEEQLDDFGSESESDGPDMSWLPDPDKVYGKKDHSDENESERSENSDGDDNQQSDSSSQEEIHRPEKRKLVSKGVEQKSVKKKKMNAKIEELSEALSISEAEQLAMQLLKGRK